MAEQSFLAKLGLRLGTLGSSASLAIALPLANGNYSPAAATDASRIGFFGDRTAAAEKLSAVVMGVESLRVRSAGVDTLVKLTTVASASGGAGLNIPHGAAPSSPVDGDFWSTTAGFYGRVNGATVGPFGSGGTPAGADTQIQFNNAGAFGATSGFALPLTSGVYRLSHGGTTTATSDVDLASHSLTANPGSAAAGSYRGVYGYVSTFAGNANMSGSTLHGGYFRTRATLTSTSTAPNQYGAYSLVEAATTNGGSIVGSFQTLVGSSANISVAGVTGSTASASVVTGIEAAASFGGAGGGVAITTYTALSLPAPTITGSVTITNRYGIYQADTAATNSLLGRTVTSASTTTRAGLNIAHGAAPSSPVDGDFWSTTAGFYGRVNGTTVGPFGAGGGIGGSIASSQIAVGSGTNTVAGSAALTWNGSAIGVGATNASLDLYINTAGAQTGEPAVTLRTDSRYDAVVSATAGLELRYNYSSTLSRATLAANGFTVDGLVSAGGAAVTGQGVLQAQGVTASYVAALASLAAQVTVYGGNTNNRLSFGVDNSVANTVGFLQSWNSVSPSASYFVLNPAGGCVSVGAAGINPALGPTTSFVVPASTTGLSSLRIPHGAAPSSPVNGDIWTTTTGVYAQINGGTVGPFGGGLSYFTAARSVAAPNATTPAHALQASGTEANIDAIVTPKATGAFLLQTPDNTTTGGNKRGANAVDLQMGRSAATQVASGDNATVSGINSTASASAAVALGDTCTASGTQAFAAGGDTAATNTNAVALGRSTTASGAYAAALGGSTNTASGDYSIVMGRQGIASLLGERAFSSGRSSSNGDRQLREFMLHGNTTTDTPLTLTLPRNLVLPNYTTWTFVARVVARRDSGTGTLHLGFEVKGVIHREASAAATTIEGTVTSTSLGGAAGACTATADTTNGALAITVTGVASTTYAWACHVEVVQAQY